MAIMKYLKNIYLNLYFPLAEVESETRVMTRYMKLLDNNPDLLRERAKEYMKRREWDRALKCLDKTLQKTTRYFDAEEDKPNKQVSISIVYKWSDFTLGKSILWGLAIGPSPRPDNEYYRYLNYTKIEIYVLF